MRSVRNRILKCAWKLRQYLQVKPHKSSGGSCFIARNCISRVLFDIKTISCFGSSLNCSLSPSSGPYPAFAVDLVLVLPLMP